MEPDMDSPCFYCDVVAGKSGVTEVPLRSSTNLIAFYDPKPKWVAHIILIPREHTNLYKGVNSLLLLELIQTAREVIAYIERAHPECSYVQEFARVGANQGPHLSVHIITSNDLLF